MKKIGFVTPWYGDSIPGGAENELRGLVKHLKAAGVEVEVLTTCVKKFASDWNVDFHGPGLFSENGISVRRFRVRKRNVDKFDRVNFKLMNDQAISAEEEKSFVEEMINSPDLYRFIDIHRDEYQLFVFIPYMFGTTFYGCQVCPEKTILIPCLHNEPYAFMNCFKEVFPAVKGMIFLSDPEKDLAEKIYGISGELFKNLGGGVDTEFSGNEKQFREKYGLDSPFMLYAGRKESGKNVDQLVQFFAEYKRRNPSDLKLVLIGGGQIDLPSREIIDLGFVPSQDKYDAYAAASVLCNPSRMESFSLIIMESWLLRKPVLVNCDCDVTTDFVRKANGGLYYRTYKEFEKCLEYLLSHVEIAEQMGKNGEQFVRAQFSWDVIVRRYTEYFHRASGEI